MKYLRGIAWNIPKPKNPQNNVVSVCNVGRQYFGTVMLRRPKGRQEYREGSRCTRTPRHVLCSGPNYGEGEGLQLQHNTARLYVQ